MWLPKEGFDFLKYLIVALTIIFIIGLRDDLIPMRPIYKIINQLIPTILVIYFFDQKIQSFYALGVGGIFPEYFQWIATILTVIVITNSYNLVDGIDGLAASLGVIALALFGSWYFTVGDIYMSVICFSFTGAYLSFLNYNWQPSKIFMGDTGALLLGFLISFVVIDFFNTNNTLTVGDSMFCRNPISIAIGILIIPLLDTIRVFVIRVSQNKSPFTPDNNHMHHKLLKLGLGHSKTVLVLLAINIIFVFSVVLLRRYHEIYSMLSIILLSGLITLMLTDKFLDRIFPAKISH